jgi:two-component system chemotaxis response regulator CheB
MTQTLPPLRKIRAVIVDDSMFMRTVISRLLTRDGRFEVVGEAKNGREAVELAGRMRPDVMTMDVNMPVLDGVEAVRQIMRMHPVPVVMVSAHTTEGAQATLEALSAGAVDFVAKPSGEVSADLSLVEGELAEKLMTASNARPRTIQPFHAVAAPTAPLVTWSPEGPRVAIIAVSTGGPAALARVIPALPGDLDCAVVVVQHMPPEFTAALAKRLDALSALTVAEAADGDRLRQGKVYIAPGGRHLNVEPPGVLRTVDTPPVNGCKPSADVTMQSAARILGYRAIGVVMTGMGRDGAEGLRAIRTAGGRTIAQDEASCVVFGMPRAAIELGVVDRVVTLEAIAAAIRSR